MAVVLLVVTFVAFAAIWLQPGDCFTNREMRDPEGVEQAREQLGLGKPFLAQYWHWIQSIFKGNFGVSCKSGFPPVTQVLFRGRLHWSLILAGTVFILSWGIGVPLGIYSAVRQESGRDYTVRFFGTLSTAMPVFLLALFLILLLYLINAKQWGLHIGRIMAPQYVGVPWSWAKVLNVLLHLGPMVLMIVAVQWAVLARHLRGHLLDVLGQPYIQVARSKGVSERWVVYKHALRNALHPLISLMGFWLPSLFESTLAVAIIINLPIVELSLWDAIKSQDQYVVLGGLFFLGVVLIVGNLLADLSLAWIDPRIRY
jgi:peptide/nickel transport system permease protein